MGAGCERGPHPRVPDPRDEHETTARVVGLRARGAPVYTASAAPRRSQCAVHPEPAGRVDVNDGGAVLAHHNGRERTVPLTAAAVPPATVSAASQYARSAKRNGDSRPARPKYGESRSGVSQRANSPAGIARVAWIARRSRSSTGSRRSASAVPPELLRQPPAGRGDDQEREFRGEQRGGEHKQQPGWIAAYDRGPAVALEPLATCPGLWRIRSRGRRSPSARPRAGRRPAAAEVRDRRPRGT